MVGVFVYTFLCLQHASFKTKLSKIMTSFPDTLPIALQKGGISLYSILSMCERFHLKVYSLLREMVGRVFVFLISSPLKLNIFHVEGHSLAQSPWEGLHVQSEVLVSCQFGRHVFL